MGSKEPNDKANQFSLRHWVIGFILILVGYQVFTGVTLKKVGIPGIIDLEFHDSRGQSSDQNSGSSRRQVSGSNDRNPSDSTLENIIGQSSDDDWYEVEVEIENQPSPVSINIAYSGDNYGCMLPITIDIGGISFVPTGNLYTVSGVEEGPADYYISGEIHCAALGSCQVYGEGVIGVQSGRTYNLVWQNTGYAQCSAVLQ